MKLVVRVVEVVASALHLPDPAHAGVSRTAVAAAWFGVAAGLSYLASHASSLALSPLEVALVGAGLQGVSKWRRS